MVNPLRMSRNVYGSNPAFDLPRHYDRPAQDYTDAPSPEGVTLERLGVKGGGLVMALGAGGATGLAYLAGTLWALEEATGVDLRYAPDVIVGTSAGSICAAYLRHGVSPRDLSLMEPPEWTSPDPDRRQLLVPHWVGRGELCRRLIGTSFEIIHHLRRVPRANPPWEWWQSLFPAGLYSIKDADWDHQRMPREWPDRPLWVVTADMDRFERVVLRTPLLQHETADLRTALTASMALPGVWPPVRLRERRLYDGGVTKSTTHLDLAIQANAKVAVAIAPFGFDPGYPFDRRRLSPARRGVLKQLLVEIDEAKAAGIEVLPFAPTREEVQLAAGNLLDRSNTEEIARAAYAAGLRRLERPDAQVPLELIRELEPKKTPVKELYLNLFDVTYDPARALRGRPTSLIR